MKKISYLILAILFIVPICTYAQAPDTLWTRNIGGAGYDEAWQLKQTPDGGFIIVGYTGTPEDIFLLKTDSNGDTLWTRSYDYSTEDVGRSVEPLDDGGFILTGIAADSCVLLRTDSLGNEIWHTNLDGGYGRAVRVTSDGGFIIAGYKAISGNTYDMYIAKTNNTGDLLWSRTYGGTYAEMAWDVRETPDGGFALVGWTTLSNGYADIYLVRTDANGDSIWSKTYGGTSNSEGRSILVKDDGGFIIAGKISNTMAIISTDQNGDTLWTKTYSGGGIIANSICSTSDGCYILTGMGFYIGPIYSSCVIKIDSNGDSLWTKMLIDSTENLYLRSIVQASDGGYVAAGYHQIPNRANDVFLCKLAPDIVGVHDEIAILPENITLHQNYPNPFNANTTISFTLAESQDMNLSVYDLLGRKMEVLLDGFTNAGTHWIEFNANDYPSGLYFYRLAAANYSDTKMMVLLK